MGNSPSQQSNSQQSNTQQESKKTNTHQDQSQTPYYSATWNIPAASAKDNKKKEKK